MTETDMRDRLMEIAEPMVRRGGYNGFSFRDVAEIAGIKAASVHYHFPTKADLGAALARRYTDRFLDRLGDPAVDGPEQRLADFVGQFRAALAGDGLMCLCGILGAEIANLPQAVAAATGDFFRRNIDWLAVVYARTGHGVPESRAQAVRLISALEGALIVSRATGDDGLFETVAAGAL